MAIDRASSCRQAGYVAKLATENIQWQKRRCTGSRERPLHFVTCLSAGEGLKVCNGSEAVIRPKAKNPAEAGFFLSVGTRSLT
jgi:hypothetical protein